MSTEEQEYEGKQNTYNLRTANNQPSTNTRNLISRMDNGHMMQSSHLDACMMVLAWLGYVYCVLVVTIYHALFFFVK